MNSRSSLGPMTRTRSGSPPLTSFVVSVALIRTPLVGPCAAR
jgi:hypothetical protein